MIAVIGSLNMDLVTFTERMPRAGETIIGKSYQQVAGGKGANQADAIAKLGADVLLIGCIGGDVMGRQLIQSLEMDGVNVKHVTQLKNHTTGVAAITVNGRGENSIVVIPGANFELSKVQIDSASTDIEKSSIVVAQLEVPVDTVIHAFHLAKEKGKMTILNPAPAMILPDSLLAYIDILVPNETELEILSGLTIHNDEDLLRSARMLNGKGVKHLIVTRGEKGCIHIHKNTINTYSAYSVQAIDTTAAGDSFIGALSVALQEGRRIEEAISFAMAVGALTVTKKGAQSSLPCRADVDAFIKSNEKHDD